MKSRIALFLIAFLCLSSITEAQDRAEKLRNFAQTSSTQTTFSIENIGHAGTSGAESRLSDQALAERFAWLAKVDPILLMPGIMSSEGKLGKKTVHGSQNQIIHTINTLGEELIVGFIAIEPGTDPHTIPGFTLRNLSPSGKFASGQFRVADIQKVASQSTVNRIQASYIRHPLHMASRQMINADKVHAGLQLPSTMQGEGVIVGILDSGIDFKNIDFADENGTRILHLLEFKSDGSSSTWTKADIDNNPGSITQRDGAGGGGHGTHVAGSAVGGGKHHANYTGIAPKSDIIFVKGVRDDDSDGGFGDADIIEGITFIFDKAEELGKPAVVNLSLGAHYGSLDGTSIFEQFITELQGDGRIIVAAAGNDGFENFHAGGTISNSESIYALSIPYSDEFMMQTIWADPNAISQYSITAWGFDNNDNLYIVGDTGWLTVGTENENSARGIRILDTSIDEPAGFIYHNSVNTADPLNGDTEIVIYISDGYDTNPTDYAWIDDYIWATVVRSTVAGGQYNMYNYQAVFLPENIGITTISDLNFVAGDRNHSVGTPATANNVISVGAYVSTNSWTNTDGVGFALSYPTDIYYSDSYTPDIGEIAYFSSRGPTRDGRLAPVVSAPGDLIFSTRSRDIQNTDLEPAYLVEGGHYLGMQGTSMAAPHVSGVIALMLQANKNLGYDDIIDIFSRTSIRDTQTGPSASPVFGHGRIDAHAAVLEAVKSTSILNHDDLPRFAELLQNYPNPFNPTTNIRFMLSDGDNIRLTVFDALGREVGILADGYFAPGVHSTQFNADRLSSGMYFYRLQTSVGSHTQKMMLVK
jgi:minor extracellular serine protease Vpr